MITGAWMWPEAYSVYPKSFAVQSGGVVVLPKNSSVPVSSSGCPQTRPISLLLATRSICALSARCGVSRRANCEACPITVLTEAPACALAAGQHRSSSASSFLLSLQHDQHCRGKRSNFQIFKFRFLICTNVDIAMYNCTVLVHLKALAKHERLKHRKSASC
jgi:hypothetical protein